MAMIHVVLNAKELLLQKFQTTSMASALVSVQYMAHIEKKLTSCIDFNSYLFDGANVGMVTSSELYHQWKLLLRHWTSKTFYLPLFSLSVASSAINLW